MNDSSLLGPWVRRFLLENLVGERNLARNTQRSYRDTLRLLLPFAAADLKKPIDLLKVEDLSSDRIRTFLQQLEDKRGSTVSTRNQRLAAIRSIAQFIAINSPEHISWSGTIRTVAFKKTSRPLVAYLDKAEMDAMLRPEQRTTNRFAFEATKELGDSEAANGEMPMAAKKQRIQARQNGKLRFWALRARRSSLSRASR